MQSTWHIPCGPPSIWVSSSSALQSFPQSGHRPKLSFNIAVLLCAFHALAGHGSLSVTPKPVPSKRFAAIETVNVEAVTI
jgi:hypothetical protein